jgi:hypothetical protein
VGQTTTTTVETTRLPHTNNSLELPLPLPQPTENTQETLGKSRVTKPPQTYDIQPREPSNTLLLPPPPKAAPTSPTKDSPGLAVLVHSSGEVPRGAPDGLVVHTLRLSRVPKVLTIQRDIHLVGVSRDGQRGRVAHDVRSAVNSGHKGGAAPCGLPVADGGGVDKEGVQRPKPTAHVLVEDEGLHHAGRYRQRIEKGAGEGKGT